MNLADYNTLKRLLESEGFNLKKAFGQNFLIDDTVYGKPNHGTRTFCMKMNHIVAAKCRADRCGEGGCHGGNSLYINCRNRLKTYPLIFF